MKPIRLALSCAILSLAALLAACGPSNTVRLLPLPQPAVSTLPAPNAPRVSVVRFEDKRLDLILGIRRDGTSFSASEDVAQWFSRALADELTRAGFQVSYALNPGMARSGRPDYIVTGEVRQVQVKEVSATEYSSAMEAQFRLAGIKGEIAGESLTASLNRTAIPGAGIADDLLQQTLQEVVQPMARKIARHVEAKK